jgi:hypothetical protein
MNPDLFIGVVTYPGTRFPESSGPDGLAQSLARGIEASGGTCVVDVHDRDAYEPSLLKIDQSEISKSIDAELAAELDWRRFIAGKEFQPVTAAKLRVHRLLRRRKFLTRELGTDSGPTLGFRMVRRLVNIEIAHLSLMRGGLESGANWILILEDDAAVDSELLSAKIFADSLSEFFERSESEPAPDYVNVSRSHTDQELGIEAIYVHQADWAPNALPHVRARISARPITNTVCAILYRRQFLVDLLDELVRIPLSPVVPIDWKLNRALMNMTERSSAPSIQCWSLLPAPIVQGSMHGQPEVSA